MKKIIFIITILFGLSTLAQEQITVNKKDLPQSVLKELEKKEKHQNIKDGVELAKEISKDAGSIGKEIGTAVNEALGAVVENGEKFGKTDVGRFTMFMVFISLAGDLALGVLFGIPFLVFVNIMLYKIFTYVVKKQKKLKLENGEKKEYSHDSVADDWSEETQILFFICFWIVALVSNILIVACVIF